MGWLKSLDKKRKIILGVIGILIIISIILLIIFLLNTKKKINKIDNILNDGSVVQEVEPETATNMYTDLTKNCTGALVWNIKEGDSVNIDSNDTSACKNDNYYSKMIGYSYSDEGVTIYVNVLKNVNGKLYKLDDTYVADYNSNTLNASLENGTTYIYTFEQNKDSYKLIKVALMPVV